MGDESSSQAGGDRPTFHDFSEAFDELQRAQIVWEMFGEARHAEVPPAGAWAAKRGYNEALKRYERIVAAIIDNSN